MAAQGGMALDLRLRALRGDLVNFFCQSRLFGQLPRRQPTDEEYAVEEVGQNDASKHCGKQRQAPAPQSADDDRQ